MVTEQTAAGREDVFVSALMLPQTERLELAKQLIDSCSADEPASLIPQELGEVLRARIKAVDEGRMTTCNWSESVARVRGMLAKRKRPSIASGPADEMDAKDVRALIAV